MDWRSMATRKLGGRGGERVEKIHGEQNKVTITRMFCDDSIFTCPVFIFQIFFKSFFKYTSCRD